MPETTVSVGDISVSNADGGEVEIMHNLSGACIFAPPGDLIAALRGYLATVKEPTPLATIGNGEYAHHIGE